MDSFQKLEKHILALFQEKGASANDSIKQYLSPSATLKKRAIVRNILSRLEIDNKGNYSLKD